MIRTLGIILALHWTVPIFGQFNFDLGADDEVTLRFESTNHFILMDVRFSNVLPLKFIFDTGSEHTLLFKKEYADLLGIEYDRKIPLMGSDLSQEIYGYIARGVNLVISSAYAVKTDILVLEEDYLKLEESTGVRIDGIIGSSIFKYFVLGVNNRTGKIKFIAAESFEPPNKFVELPLVIYKNKPYIDATAQLNNEEIPVRLLLDTGAGLPVLLYTKTAEHLQLPEKTVPGTLGTGLGVHLEGYIGRLEKFSFGKFEFSNMLSSFQELSLGKLDSLTLNLKARPDLVPEVEAALGMSMDEAFPWPEAYQCMHVKLFPHGVFHAENVGGQIDEVLDQRVWLGCFPFRFSGGEAAFARIVAFVEKD
jgi:hypothetical protein